MVTTRRSTVVLNNSFENATNKGGVGLLERPEIEEKAIELDSNVSQAEKMQQNLQRLLNYDRFNEENMQQAVVSDSVKDFADEDIRPTSTTMQFGDEDIEQIREEMKASVIEEETSYHLNTKGKIAVMLYSLVVTVILALIVLNTGILSRLSQTETAMVNKVNEKVAEYNILMSEIDSISSPDYVIEAAQNLGMN